jgi:PAS domain S-box-containing protein
MSTQEISFEAERKLKYVALSLLLLVLFFAFRFSDWMGSRTLHTVMEVLATFLAFIVGVLALLRYYSKKDNMFLLLGSGFIGTAFLDGYHTVVTSSFFDQLALSPPPALIPWSWNASRYFLAIVMFLSWLAWRREKKMGEKGLIPEWIVFWGVGALTLASFAFFVYFPLPSAYYPDLSFGRPEEFGAAFFFLLALIGYLTKGDWKRQSFDHWVVYSLIIGFMTQVFFMSSSFELFDFMFDAAHGLKQMSYVFVLIGLLIGIHHLYQDIGGTQEKLVSQNDDLKRAMRSSDYQSHHIEEQSDKLENQQRALLNILEDVQKEKFKTESLANDLKKYQLAVENASDHIVITDPDGVVLYANPATTRITGFLVDEIIGHKAGKLWGGLMPSAFYEDMWKIVKIDKRVYSGKLTNRRKNGKRYQAALTISPILGDEGEVQFFVGIERDITKQTDVDRMKTEFISLASHQLRTPLSAVKWFTEMLIKGDAGDLEGDQIQFVQNISDSNDRMISLVNSLLNISRIESGRIIIEPEKISLVHLSKDIVKELRPRIQTKKLNVFVTGAADLPDADLDPGLTHEVIMNLMTNAIKYTPEGGKIEVSVVTKGDQIVLSVKDTGFGIPEAEHSRVFERFFRAENIISKEPDGTGLGLYLIKAIVDASMGKISFESVENEGTTFSVSFPIEGLRAQEGEVRLNT